jgi:hypothetical protein
MTLQGDECFDIDSDSLTGVNRGHQHTGGGMRTKALGD